VAASCPLESAVTSSSFGNWVVRIWIPAGKAITKLGLYISFAGSATTGVNGFAVYDDTGNLISSTVSDNNLWVTEGWLLKALPSPISAEGSGRFVRVAAAIEGTSCDVLYCIHDGPATMFNGGDIAHRRAWAGPSRSGGFPSTINVATEGDEYTYLPLIVVA
jgi:hypothetical protein